MSSYGTISPDRLARLIGTPHAPTIIDVRTDEDFAAVPRLIPGSRRRAATEVADWAPSLAGRSAVLVCQGGRKLSEGAAAWVRHAGGAAETLAGGFAAWAAAGLPLVPEGRLPSRDRQGRTVWVTRARLNPRDRASAARLSNLPVSSSDW